MFSLLDLISRSGSSLVCFLLMVIFMEMKQKVACGLDSDGVPSICLSHCKSNINDTKTYSFCMDDPMLQMIGRCCINGSQAEAPVLGIDLQDCGVTEQSFTKAIANISSLQYISLQKNKIHHLKARDLQANAGILYLSLPPNLHCPGSTGTWLNETSDADATYCLSEQNACHVHNVSCPDNSHCVHSGFDATECLCNPGFHGYKCLQQGVFPTSKFLAGIIIPTIGLSIFLYMTQRRYVVQPSNRKRR